jgi:hypothetical protein
VRKVSRGSGGGWGEGETRRVRLDLEEEDLIFGDLWDGGGGGGRERGVRTAGRRRRGIESSKDIGEEVGLTINDLFLPDRGSILIPSR